MDRNKTALERAFDLASSGRLTSVADIRMQLKLEGLNEKQIYGRVLINQLGDLIRNSKTEADGPAD